MPALSRVRISSHAARRWRERVEPNASLGAARLTLHQFVTQGHFRSTPRHWMAATNQTPGLRFVYWDEHPGVCVLVLDGTALTVVTKALCKPAARLRRERKAGQARRHARRPEGRVRRPLMLTGLIEDAA